MDMCLCECVRVSVRGQGSEERVIYTKLIILIICGPVVPDMEKKIPEIKAEVGGVPLQHAMCITI